MNIYDIAQRSGVSIATVSRVLNNNPNVSEQTRKLVMKIIKEENYVPNVFARGLGLNSMKMIGILCVDISDIFFAKAISLIERQLREKNFDVMLSCTGTQPEGKKKGFDLLLQKHVDAILLIGSPFKEEGDSSYIARAAEQIPVIMLNGLSEVPNVYSVLCDEQEAMFRNVSLLHEHGCSRMLYCYDTLTYNGRQKIAGYKAAYREHGLSLDEKLLIRVQKDIPAITDKIGGLIRDGLVFDAALASEDMVAIGIQQAMQREGISCPIIGFNNSILSQCTTPALTSVDNMLDTLCSTVVHHLIKLLDDEIVPIKFVVSARLVERETFRL